MYYLLNDNNKIIGVDTKLLNHLKIDGLDAFLREVAIKNLKVSITGDIVSINLNGNKEKYSFSEKITYTLIGTFKLIYLYKGEVSDLTKKYKKEEIFVNPDILDFNLFSKKIGVDKEDYVNFVKEFIDLSKELKGTINNSQRNIYIKAVKKIINLSEMLYLTTITKELTKIENLDSNTRKETINRFYTRLNGLLYEESDSALEVIEDDGTVLEEKINPIIKGKKDNSIDLDLDLGMYDKVEEKKEGSIDLDLGMDEIEEKVSIKPKKRN